MMALHSLNPSPLPIYKWGEYEVFEILNNGGLKNFNINGWVRHNGGGRSKNGRRDSPFQSNFGATKDA